jgi:TonB family protein
MKKRLFGLILGILLSGLVFTQNQDSIPPQLKVGEPLQFLAKNIKYPDDARENCITGVVIVKFSVDTTGNVDSLYVDHSIHPLLDKEALRVVTMMSGQWNPGKINGKPVRFDVRLPIKFSVQNNGCLDFDYFFKQGVNYYKKGKMDKALSSFAVAIQLNPYDVESLMKIALIKIDQNDLKSACFFLHEIKAIGKNDADTLIIKYCK